ncbi:MAG: histidine kinase N-terminal 7TM domain-containing protein [Methanobacteriota archaeon]
MIFQPYPFLLVFYLSSILTGCTAYYAWTRRNVRGARTFSILMTLLTWWTFFYACEISFRDPSLHLLFLSLEYLAIPWISGAMVVTALELIGHENALTRRIRAVIFVIPVIIFVSFFTDGYLHLFYQQVHFQVVNDLTVMVITPGLMYRVLNLANISSIIFCFIVIIREYLHTPQVFRSQLLLCIASLIIAFIGVLMYYLGPRIYPDFDISPIAISLVGAIMLTAIFRFRFFDLIHIPYHNIFENLQEGIIVLDTKNRVIELNRMAVDLLQAGPGDLRGASLPAADTILKEELGDLAGDQYVQKTVTIGKGINRSFFFVEMYPVTNSAGHIQSRMIIIRDITENIKIHLALGEAGKKLNLLNSITRHDILNQVAIIAGYAEVMHLPLENQKESEHLKLIAHAAITVKNLIQFTATYQDLGVSEPVWLSVRNVVQKAYRTLHPPDPISLQIDTNLVVFADMLLEKVFFNLMDNSLRHGGHVTRISVSSEETADGIILVYEDDGCGVEQELKERIFRQGFGKNTGYGLYLVAEILSITGISIRETGTPGCGVRFEMQIPRDGVRIPV